MKGKRISQCLGANTVRPEVSADVCGRNTWQSAVVCVGAESAVVESAVVACVCRRRRRAVRHGTTHVSTLSAVLAVAVALGCVAPVPAQAFRFPQQSSSSSSSISSADVGVVSVDQMSPLVTSSVLNPNRPPNTAALFVSSSGNNKQANSYEQVAEETRPKLGGQKETEQVMNPNEVFVDRVAILEPLAADTNEWQTDVDLDLEPLDKRAKWNSLQGGWGKRGPSNWNKLSAAWGKRRAPGGVNGWNNLSGMWGKKRAKWNELSGMWGKRAWNDMAGGWGKKKRSAHWNKLSGMWGKRSVLPPKA